MLASHAPPSFINTFKLFRSHSPYPRIVSLVSATRFLSVGNHRIAARTVTSMAEANSIDGHSSPDHVTGSWSSVPELRLRSHRFTVPLDYSIDPHASPKISIFAREVVTGTWKLITSLNHCLIRIIFVVIIIWSLLLNLNYEIEMKDFRLVAEKIAYRKKEVPISNCV